MFVWINKVRWTMRIGLRKDWRLILLRNLLRLWGAVVCGALAGSAGAQTGGARSGAALSMEQLRAAFASPPADARPMVRWWWFGPAVVKPEIARELDRMHDAGIGGGELAAEDPLALDDPAKGIANLRD